MTNDKISEKLLNIGFNPLQILLIMYYDKYHYHNISIEMEPEIKMWVHHNDLTKTLVESNNISIDLINQELKYSKNIYLFSLDKFNFCFNIKRYENICLLSELFSGGKAKGFKMLLEENWKEKLMIL